MKGKLRRKQKKKRSKFLWITVAVIGTITIGTAAYVIGFSNKGVVRNSPEELLVEYMNHIPKQEYEQMYEVLDIEVSGNFNQEDFIKRNSLFSGKEKREAGKVT